MTRMPNFEFKSAKNFKLPTLQNLLLITIAILLFSILWTLNKGLRQFLYHRLDVSRGYWHIDYLQSKYHPRVGALGLDMRLCNRYHYFFNFKVKTENFDYPECKVETSKFKFPIVLWTISGLGEIFDSSPKKLEEPTEEQILEHLKEADPETYNEIIEWNSMTQEEKTARIEEELNRLKNTLNGRK